MQIIFDTPYRPDFIEELEIRNLRIGFRRRGRQPLRHRRRIDVRERRGHVRVVTLV